jgi:hypothetical protein
MWKNMVTVDRPRMTIRYSTEKILFACRITEVRIETYVYNIINVILYYKYYIYIILIAYARQK